MCTSFTRKNYDILAVLLFFAIFYCVELPKTAVKHYKLPH